MVIAEFENELSLMRTRIQELESQVYGRDPQINQDDFDIYHQATLFIRDIGIPAHIKGYRYIRDAIVLIFHDDEMVFDITKKLYPTLAKKHNTTPSRVERAMRHAIELAWSQKEFDQLVNMFRNFRSHRPTNAEFLASVVDVLNLKKYR